MSNFFFAPVLWPSSHTAGVDSRPSRTEWDKQQALSIQHLSRMRRSFKQRPASLEPLGLAGIFPGLAMACSLKDYLQGSRGYLADLS